MSTGAWSAVERVIFTVALSVVSVVVVQSVPPGDQPAIIVALAVLFHGEPLLKRLSGLWAAPRRSDEPGALE